MYSTKPDLTRIDLDIWGKFAKEKLDDELAREFGGLLRFHRLDEELDFRGVSGIIFFACPRLPTDRLSNTLMEYLCWIWRLKYLPTLLRKMPEDFLPNLMVGFISRHHSKVYLRDSVKVMLMIAEWMNLEVPKEHLEILKSHKLPTTYKT